MPRTAGFKPRVLLAARALAREPFRIALGNEAEMIEAETLETALAELKGARPPDLICCTVYFDESKMFDLLRSVKIECAHVPVVCARILPKDISNISIEAVGIACRSLGAASFIDVPALAERYGAEGADMHLRRELFKQLGLGDA